MGELHHAKARRNRRETEGGNDDHIVPVACEISFSLRIPDHDNLGGRIAEKALETVCELRGWKRSDRIERRGPKSIHVHSVWFAYGRYEAARRGIKDVLRELETMEDWYKAEIGLDTFVSPLLY